jgi:hypothetical protein
VARSVSFIVVPALGHAANPLIIHFKPAEPANYRSTAQLRVTPGCLRGQQADMRVVDLADSLWRI